MNYLRSLILNFLVVFFVDRVAPGIEIIYYHQIPNIAADIVFCALIGLMNASIFPFLSIMEIDPTRLKLLIGSALISFGAFIVVAIVPFGVSVVEFIGIVSGGAMVWAVSFLTNYLDARRKRCSEPEQML
jgi:hypothetical protein